MTLTLSQAREAFKTGNLPVDNDAGRWFREHGYQARDWNGLCEGVLNYLSWFTTGVEPTWYGSAAAGWNASPAAVGMDPYAAPFNAVHWFSIPGVPDGHAQLSLGNGQILHAHSLIQDAWATNIGTADFNWFKNQRPWYVYLGWTYQNGSNVIDLIPDAAVKGRFTAGPAGASRRAIPTTIGNSPILTPNGDIDPGDYGDFDAYIEGQDPYGNGNNKWLRGTYSKNWFYSGAFLNVKLSDLQNLGVWKPATTPTTPPTPMTPGKPINDRNPSTAPYVFEKDFDIVTGVYPADRTNWEPGNFPARPKGIVWHQMGTPGIDHLGSTKNEFLNAHSDEPGDQARSAHFGIEDDEIWQFVSLDDRAYGSGPGGNDNVQVELNPKMSAKTLASARKLAAALRDRNGGDQLDKLLHRDIPGAHTTCGVLVVDHLPELDVALPPMPTEPEPEVPVEPEDPNLPDPEPEPEPEPTTPTVPVGGKAWWAPLVILISPLVVAIIAAITDFFSKQ